MKKILTLLLAGALMLSAVACTTSNSSSSSLAPSSSSSMQESLSSEEMPPESTPNFTIPEANQKLGDVITAARTAEFNEAYSIIMSQDDPQAQMIFDVAGLKAEDMEAYAISISPMNIKAYGVAIIKPAKGKEEAVLTALNNWVASQKKSFEQYLVDQLEIANAATVDKLDDGTLVLVMSEGGEAIQKSILDAMKK